MVHKIDIQWKVSFSTLYQSNPQFVLQTSGESHDTLHRLREFVELFLADGLNSESAYTFGLKDV